MSLGWAACGPPPPNPVPEGSFAFGVFGDGPYYPWENGRFERLLADVSATELEWFLHVGDILWAPCSDEAFHRRLAELNGVRHPVVYTPGDNEWTDCHERRPGGYDPLDRLSAIRRIFFENPSRSLGATPMSLLTQARDPAYAEFVENVRWTHGGFVFATVHLVGSSNGLGDFSGRTEAHDAEVERRAAAAVAWMREAFEVARRDSARGVVLAAHANIGFAPFAHLRTGFESFHRALRDEISTFGGPVLWIHGDSHQGAVDQPLISPSGDAYPNFTRVETLGSPRIAWTRVVVDTIVGRFTVESPRIQRGWW